MLGLCPLARGPPWGGPPRLLWAFSAFLLPLLLLRQQAAAEQARGPLSEEELAASQVTLEILAAAEDGWWPGAFSASAAEEEWKYTREVSGDLKGLGLERRGWADPGVSSLWGQQREEEALRKAAVGDAAAAAAWKDSSSSSRRAFGGRPSCPARNPSTEEKRRRASAAAGQALLQSQLLQQQRWLLLHHQDRAGQQQQQQQRQQQQQKEGAASSSDRVKQQGKARNLAAAGDSSRAPPPPPLQQQTKTKPGVPGSCPASPLLQGPLLRARGSADTCKREAGEGGGLPAASACLAARESSKSPRQQQQPASCATPPVYPEELLMRLVVGGLEASLEEAEPGAPFWLMGWRGEGALAAARSSSSPFSSSLLSAAARGAAVGEGEAPAMSWVLGASSGAWTADETPEAEARHLLEALQYSFELHAEEALLSWGPPGGGEGTRGRPLAGGAPAGAPQAATLQFNFDPVPLHEQRAIRMELDRERGGGPPGGGLGGPARGLGSPPTPTPAQVQLAGPGGSSLLSLADDGRALLPAEGLFDMWVRKLEGPQAAAALKLLSLSQEDLRLILALQEETGGPLTLAIAEDWGDEGPPTPSDSSRFLRPAAGSSSSSSSSSSSAASSSWTEASPPEEPLPSHPAVAGGLPLNEEGEEEQEEEGEEEEEEEEDDGGEDEDDEGFWFRLLADAAVW
ncbi:hypothetical protein Efla_007819 [Eimeria flavescens]